MVRPRLSSTTIIAHGHLVRTALSMPMLPSNSSKSTELIAHTLSSIAASYDLRCCTVDCQGDNAAKELKNVTTLRFGAMLTALHHCAGFNLCMLSSGHSHEDVDHLFSMASAWYDRHAELPDPGAFRDCLNTFYQRKETRPYEKDKTACVVDQVRDWTLGLNMSCLILHDVA